MKVYELFDIEYGINLELNACDITSDSSGVNFVSRTGENNGVVAKVKYIKGKIPQPSGILTCAGSGSVLSTFVQDKPFYSGRDLYTLTPKKEMSLKEKLFYCHCIKLNSYRYNYGCQANKTLRNINLPPIPKWLESYNIDYSRITTKVKRKNLPMAVNVWKEFYLKDLFDVRGTKTTKIADLERYGKGKYPYITTQATNNGAAGFYDFYTEKGNVLVIDSAVIGRCSYQGYDFSASDHVEKLIPKNIFNKYIGLFITAVINKESFRYRYGRKYGQLKILKTKIKLPADKSGTPDWQFMESYIKQLPYSDKI